MDFRHRRTKAVTSADEGTAEAAALLVAPEWDLLGPSPAAESAPVEQPALSSSATAAEVLAWVDGDPGRASVALEAEMAGRARKQLSAALSAVIDADQAPTTPAA